MKLLLIRHAAAVARGAPGIADTERPLTADGEAEFRSGAGGLAWIVDPPDVLLTSPLLRARATAAIAAHAFGRVEPRIESTLAQGTPETVLTALANHGLTARTIAVVGHEPLLSAVLARLMGISDSDRIAFEKGGVALMDLPDGLSAPGRLVWFLAPSILRTLAGRHESAAEGRTRERTLMAALGAARVRAVREGATLRWLLLSAVRDYGAGTWTPRRDASA
jgi:phosphohistidine phosphatase